MTSERTLAANHKTAAESGVYGYLLFVALDFPSGMIRAHNGQGTYTFGGNDYLGVGAFGGIDPMAETIDTVPNPIKVLLSSITDEVVTAVRTDNIYGRDATIYVGSVDDNFNLVADPDLWVDGYMEKKELIVGETNGVSVTIQDDSAKFRQRSNKRYTIEDHQTDHAGDLFLEFLPFVMDATVVWGGEQVRSGNVNHGDGLTGGNSGGDNNRRGGGPKNTGRR